MDQGFSSQLWEEAGGIWRRILNHPFLRDVKAGTLPIEKFRYYLLQDYLYLEGFGRAVALALAKAPNSTALERLSKRVLTPIERPLHRELFLLAKVSAEDVGRTVPAPTNLAYINHLLKTASLGALGPTAASLLPCPWFYHELGPLFGEVDHPVYGPWTAFYVQGRLAESVKAWRGFVDEAADQMAPAGRDALRQAFLTSCRYEWLFWEMAYKQESWPL